MGINEDDLRDVETSMAVVDLHPSLRDAVQAGGLDGKKLSVGLKMFGPKPDLSDREAVFVTDGQKDVLWKVPSLRALFRGDAPAPTDLSHGPPPAYVPLFFFIEKHLLTFCDAERDQTDAALEEVYGNLRRRPDGKSRDALHFFLWQVAAGLAGIRAVSAAEFEAIFGRLALSASHFRMGPVSRNYVTTLRMTIARG